MAGDIQGSAERQQEGKKTRTEYFTMAFYSGYFHILKSTKDSRPVDAFGRFPMNVLRIRRISLCGVVVSLGEGERRLWFPQYAL